MPQQLQLQKLPGERGWRVEKKKVSVFCVIFWPTGGRNREFVGKNAFCILWHKQQAIACCQAHSDYGPPKMSLKLTV